MKLTSDFITVFFDTAAILTLTSDKKKKRLYNILQCEKEQPKNSCIDRLSMQYIEHVDFNTIDVRGIHIDPLWHDGATKPLSCAPDCDAICGTRERMRRCAENLSTGKCRDEFMRRTLGAALLPELYANETQK